MSLVNVRTEPGEHSSIYKGCQVSKRAVKVELIRTDQGISYAEAVKSMTQNTVTSKSVGAKRGNTGTCEGCSEVGENTLCTLKRILYLSW